MNESEDFDPEYLADLEARLYSQVFHSVCESQTENESTQMVENMMKASNKQKYRYFESKQNGAIQADFIPISIDANLPVFQQEIIISPNSADVGKEGGHGSIIQNNITVHQYTLPVVYRNNRNPSATSSIKVREEVGDAFLEARRQRRREKRIRKRQRMKLRAPSARISQQKLNQVICLSDSDDDCVVIQSDNIVKQIDKQEIQQAVLEDCADSDEDIIYIPSPAPVIINIDGDDTNDKPIQNNSPSKSTNSNETSQMRESVVSNDFLDTNSVDNAANFNFSLHGADFNAQSNDFVRPLNPLENCETESSCSTNDQSREFNNSVKTIVFDEIEFPREDIFAEKNLESFKTFITPQRKSKTQSTPKSRSRAQAPQKKENVTKTASSSSCSSSESDYEDGSNCDQSQNVRGKKCLPSLSLMQPQKKNIQASKGTPETSKDTEHSDELCSKSINEPIKVSNKSRKKRLQCNENDISAKDAGESQKSERDKPGENISLLKKGPTDVTAESETGRPTEVSSKRQFDNESTNLSTKSRKKRQLSTNLDTVKDGKDSGESQNSQSVQPTENKDHSEEKELSLGELGEAEIVAGNTSTPKLIKKRKSKKSEHEDSLMSQIIVIDEADDNEVNGSAKKKKKRKSFSEIPDISGLRDFVVIDDLSLAEQDLQDVVQEETGNDLKLANCVSTTPKHNRNRNRFSDQTLVDVTDFSVESIQRTQSDNPDLWQISFRDRHSLYNVGEPKGPRCSRCRHFGHFAIHCMEKPGPPPCYLCGEGNHQEPRCPNKICTQCGTPGAYSTTYCGNCFKFRHTVCRMCQQKGHIEKNCPDLWRRYHLTTERGPIVPATGDQLKPRNQRWCSGCGLQGHLEHECVNYHRVYPPSLPYVVNYDDVLNQEDKNTGGVPQNDGQDIASTADDHPTVSIDPCFTNVLQNALSLELQNEAAIPEQGAVIPIDAQFRPNPYVMALQKSVMPSPGATALNELTTVSANKYGKMKINMVLLKNYFMSAPGRRIQSFLEQEMAELDTCCSVNAKSMKMLLFRTERFYSVKKKSKYDQRRVAVGFRALNMFIFGHHQLKDGRQHLYYLRGFVQQRKCSIDEPKRKSLLSAYCYIFGPERHDTMNYFGILRAIQQRYGNNTA